MRRRFQLSPLVLLACLTAGCTSLYYASMSKLGQEKRDILVKRIVEGKKDQEEARKQIKSTMETFQELTGFEGGDLEKVYKKLNGEYEDARDRANDLKSRIKSIDQVAKDMFREWEKEIDGMRDRSLKTRSRTMLSEARRRHQAYMTVMHQTEKKMDPVIQAFQDHVVFLKHNLNARAMKSLKSTAAKMDGDVEALIADIDKSMKEADSFIQSLQAPEAS